MVKAELKVFIPRLILIPFLTLAELTQDQDCT